VFWLLQTHYRTLVSTTPIFFLCLIYEMPSFGVLENGKIVEAWMNWGELGFLRQIGVTALSR
jgi:hypothetical protein